MSTRVDESYKVGEYYPTIGIECHVQLKTKSKLFAPVSNEANDAEPNTLVSHICFGLPGALPVLNKEAVALASKAAFALETEPQKFSKFDRKHYFYPDLPLGYQISQFDEPIILGGGITITLEDGTQKHIAITRAHLEADAGKSTHPAGTDYSLVDLNRAGTPLLEIVSEPELHSGQEAKAYAKELWLRMKYAGVSDVDLYHGNMRFDVNVSVSKNPEQFGTRTETKNLNSFRSVERAVDYEIKRQIAAIESGQEIVQETRGWLDDEHKTVSQRTKEDAHDYRYFPDPDIPPVELDEAYISEIRDNLPVMPAEWREKLSALGLDSLQIENLLETDVEYDGGFLQLITESQDSAKNFANWIVNIEVPMRRDDETGATHTITPERRREVFNAVQQLSTSGKVSSNSAKSLIEELLIAADLPDSIEGYADKKGFIQMSDSGEMEKIVDQVIAENPKPVEDIKNGEMKAIGFLVGQIMKLSAGKANPAEAQKLIREKLK